MQRHSAERTRASFTINGLCSVGCFHAQVGGFDDKMMCESLAIVLRAREHLHACLSPLRHIYRGTQLHLISPSIIHTGMRMMAKNIGLTAGASYAAIPCIDNISIVNTLFGWMNYARHLFAHCFCSLDNDNDNRVSTIQINVSTLTSNPLNAFMHSIENLNIIE